MMETLPYELITKIFDYLDHEGLMKMYEIDSYKDFIKNNVWKNIKIKLVKHKRIKKFIDSGWINCFVKYDLSRSEIDNDLLKYFSHCDYLDLFQCCKLTDKCTEYLKNCYEVNLNECHQITDIGAMNLSNCPILKLGQTRITRNCIKHLSTCESLDITECNIIDEDLKLLENVKSLDISYCKNITLKGIQYLKNIQVLNLEMCTNLIHEIRNIDNTEYYDYFSKYSPHIRLMRSIPSSKLEPWERDEF
jgi:hypothetical protein